MAGIVVTETSGGGQAHLRFSAGGNPASLAPGKKSGALVIGSWSFDEILSLACDSLPVLNRSRGGGLKSGEDFRAAFGKGPLFIHSGGWQSWSAGWELCPGESLPRRVLILPELIKLTGRDGGRPEPGEITGHFIVYLRAGEAYLCLASMEGGAGGFLRPGEKALAPLSFRINRKKRRLSAEIFCPGKKWRAGETLAELRVFAAGSYFDFKDTLAALYRQEGRFKSLSFLYPKNAPRDRVYRQAGSQPGGYESWYNRYTRIDEKTILEDLESLGKTENLLKLRYLDRGDTLVFQIDDGWERAVGDWEIDGGRFPGGLKSLAEKIEKASLVPGLWIAPFIVTRRARIFREKPEWLLRDRRGRPVSAGFNHLWDGRYYCLDLSRPDVLDYIGSLIGRAIEEWGFRYLKIDFLYAGMLSGLHAEGGAVYEHYEKACEILVSRTKNSAGLPVAYLGCGGPLGPSYSRFPLFRIGADTREEWDWNLVKFMGHVGRPGAYLNIKNTIGRSFLNGTVFLNDPDVVFLRSANCALTENEKELIGLVNFLLAAQIMSSDDPARLSGEDLALAGRLSRLYDALAGDEYGALSLEKDVYLLISRSGKTTGLINLRGRPFTLERKNAKKLCAAFAGGKFLADHRLGEKRGGFVFDSRSITLLH
ncbi:MAG: alpha-galactosidase [Treponema sp.]|jgi:alpha-galactosidase|nr:alpha-galactosidase [Treponema sp.]